MRQGVWHTSPFYQMKTLASISIIISIIIHHRQLAALNCYSANQTQPCTDVLLQLPEVPEIAFGTY